MQGDGMGKEEVHHLHGQRLFFSVNLRGQGGSPFTFEFQTWRRAPRRSGGAGRVGEPAHPREREAPERHHCGPATISHEYTLMEHEARFPPLRSTLIAIAAALNNVAFGYDGMRS